MGKTLQAITIITDRLGCDYEEEGERKKIISKLLHAGQEALRVIRDDEVNDQLRFWDETVQQIISEGRSSLRGDRLIYSASCLIYILAKEILLNGGADATAKKVWDKVLAAVKDVEKYDSSLSEKITSYFLFYDEVVRYKLLEARIEVIYEASLNDRFEKAVDQNKRIVSDLEERVDKNKKLLSSIESKTAFTSLLSGFEQYSGSIESKLRWVVREVVGLKLLMFLVPVAGVFYSIYGKGDFKVYVGLFSLLLVVGLLLRFSARKEDQMEQLLSSINTRTSLAVFHKYQLHDMDEGEKLIAHERFQSFIYSEIKTSEWHAPDVSDSIAKILKSAQK